MATVDWTTLTDSVSDGVAAHGVSAPFANMTGGSDYFYAFHSSTSTILGGIGKYYTNAGAGNFTLGSSISGAVVRRASEGSTGYSAFIFTGLGGSDTATSASDTAYLLGLSNANPSHIVLAKNSISTGIPDGAPGTLGILAKSTDIVDLNEWVHLKLTIIAQANGDVVLRCYRSASDLDEAADWQPIEGLDEFVDDVTKINSGSDPLTAGRPGFGFSYLGKNRVAAISNLQITRQTAY